MLAKADTFIDYMANLQDDKKSYLAKKALEFRETQIKDLVEETQQLEKNIENAKNK